MEQGKAAVDVEILAVRSRQDEVEGDGRDVTRAQDADEGVAPGRRADGVEEGAPVVLRERPEHIPGDWRARLMVGIMVEDNGGFGVAVGESVAGGPLADLVKGVVEAGAGCRVYQA